MIVAFGKLFITLQISLKIVKNFYKLFIVKSKIFNKGNMSFLKNNCQYINLKFSQVFIWSKSIKIKKK